MRNNQARKQYVEPEPSDKYHYGIATFTMNSSVLSESETFINRMLKWEGGSHWSEAMQMTVLFL